MTLRNLRFFAMLSLLSIFGLFVARQYFGLSEPLASRLMLVAVVAAICSFTALGIGGFKSLRRDSR